MNTKLQLTHKIERDILQQFETLQAQENQAIPARWLSLIYYATLTDPEKTVFHEAIDNLIAAGLVAPVRDTIKLTQKGAAQIYPSRTCTV